MQQQQIMHAIYMNEATHTPIRQIYDEPTPENWASIYIPRIHFEYTREEISDLVENKMRIGKVSRIDFAPTKDGSGRMTFIHLSQFFPEGDAAKNAMEHSPNGIEVPIHFNKYPTINMRFVINRRPIPKTEFTMETLTDAITRTGYTVEQHTKDLKIFQDNTNDLFDRMNNWSIQIENRILDMEAQLFDSNSTIETLRLENETLRKKQSELEEKLAINDQDVTYLSNTQEEIDQIVQDIDTKYEEKLIFVHAKLFDIENKL